MVSGGWDGMGWGMGDGGWGMGDGGWGMGDGEVLGFEGWVVMEMQ